MSSWRSSPCRSLVSSQVSTNLLFETHRRVQQAAEEKGILVLDLYPHYRGLEGETISIRPGNPHINRLGGQIAARAIREFLVERDLLPSS